MEEKRERKLHPLIEGLMIAGVIFGCRIVASFIFTLYSRGKGLHELSTFVIVLDWIALLYPVIAAFLCAKVIERRKAGIVAVILVVVLCFSLLSGFIRMLVSNMIAANGPLALRSFSKVQSFLRPLIDAVLATVFVHVFRMPELEANMYDRKMHCSLFKHTLLLVFTFGIWPLVWILRATAYLNCVAGEERRNPATKLLLCMLVPFYSIYWTYKSAQRIDTIAKSANIVSDLATPCFILAFLVPIVPPILMQDKINKIIGTATT